MSLTIRSSAFDDGEMIPRRHTCDGDDTSPPLSWSDVPDGTRSLALICDDPDAPMGTFVHWVLFNLPSDARKLPESLAKEASLEDGSIQGKNDFGKVGYGGPCPPGGTHRYNFKLYALDRKLDLPSGVKKSDLLDAMEGHVLGEARLVGTYRR
jgi:Raf kinase inhibitor-like YbhB/YbcL family protein